jgi:hypothetical protein
LSKGTFTKFLWSGLGFVLALGYSSAFAQYAPQKLNISGALFNPGGSPVTQTSVDFKIEILDKNATCVLYSEQHLGQNLSNPKGTFALEIGSGTSVQNFLQATTTLGWGIFANPGVNSGAFAGCPAGVTMNAGDERLIRVSYNLGGGMTAMTPDVTITSASYALVANTLEGKTAAEFVQVKDDGATDLNQSNVENVFSVANYAKLLQLLNNTFSAGYSFNNQRVTNVAAPTAATDAVNRGWVDGHVGDKTAVLTGIGAGVGNGSTLIWDAGGNQWITGTPTAVDATKLPLAGGTMSGNITMGGFDLANVGNIFIGNQKRLQLGTYTTAQEPALVAGDRGTLLYNTDLNVVRMWNGSAWTAVAGGASGIAGGDLTGSYPNPSININAVTTAKVADNAILSAKINTGFASNMLLSTNATTGDSLTYVGCGLNQIMTFDAAGKWSCTTVMSLVGTSGVAAGMYGSAVTVPRFGVNAAGAVTSAVDVAIGFPVTQVAGKTGNVILNAADIGGLGTAALEYVGTGAGDVPQLDAGGKILESLLPDTISRIIKVTAGAGLLGGGTSGDVTVSLDLTNVDAYKIRGRNVAATAPNNTEILMWNSTTSVWEPQAVPSAPVSSVAGRTGAVVLDVADINSGAGKYFNYAPNNTACATDEVLKWNGSAWHCDTDENAGGTITQVVAGVGLTGGGITGAVTVNLTNTAVTVGSYGGAARSANFTVDQQGRLTVAGEQDIALPTTQINQQGAANGEVLKWNGSAWMPLPDTGGIAAIDPGNGILISGTATVKTISVDTGITANKILQLDSNGALGIGTASVTAGSILDLYATGSNNSSLLLPRSTSALRPTAGVDGMIRYNTSLAKFEVYENGNWFNMATGATADNLGNHIATQQILSVTGTAAAPGFSFNGEANRGMFALGTGGVAISAGSANRLTVAADGNVGIGTTEAITPLEVMNANPLAAASMKDTLTLSDSTPNGAVAPGSGSGIRFRGQTNFGHTTVGGIWAETTGVGTGGNLYFATRGAGGSFNPRMLLTSEGNVGIGTANPGALLDIYGTGAANSAIIIPRDTAANRPSGVNGMIRYNSDSQKFEVYEGTWQNMITAQGSGADNLGNHTATQAIVAIAGTASNPGYTFADNNRGMFAAGTGAVAFSAGSLERMRIDANGFVGIGTANPVGNLAIHAATDPTLVLDTADTVDGGIQIRFDVAGVTRNYIWQEYVPGNSVNDIAIGNGSGASAFRVGTGGDISIGGLVPGYDYPASTRSLSVLGFGSTSATTNTYLMNSVGAPLMLVRNDGNVGIGTASPGALLDIYSTGAANSAVILPRDTAANRPAGVNGMIRYNSDSQKFEVYEGTWQNMITAQGSGADNLGSHTATQQILSVTGTAAAPGYSFNGESNRGMFALGTGGVAISTGSANRLTVAPDGNVGIGTSAPNSTLEVNAANDIQAVFKATGGANAGGIAVDTDSAADGSGIVLRNQGNNKWGLFGPYNGTGFSIYDYVGVAERFRILTNGNVGISTVNPGALLDIYSTGATNSAVILPRDTAANRPAGINGMIRYNSTTNKFEVYEGTWQNMLSAQASGADNLGNHTATQTILAITGSATQPSVAFSTDTDTGLFNPAADNLAFTTGGAERVRISDIGNVGIGTSAPEAPLHTVGTGSGGLALFQINRPNTSVSAAITLYKHNTAGVGAAGIGASIRFETDNDAGTRVDHAYINAPLSDATAGAEYGALTFRTMTAGALPTEKMRINGFGHLGVGTGTPGARLDIFGTGAASAIIIPRDETAGRPTGVNGMIRYNTNTARFEGFENGAWTNLSATGAGSGDFKADGSVAMTGAFRSIAGAAGAPGITFVGDTSTGIWSPSAGAVAVSNFGTESFRISPEGKVGIGTNNPSGALPNTSTLLSIGPGGFYEVPLHVNISDVAGGASAGALAVLEKSGADVNLGIVADATHKGGIWFGPENSRGRLEYDNASNAMSFSTFTSERMRIDQVGNVGIGTTNPGATLHVSDAVNNGTAMFESSAANTGVRIRNTAASGGFYTLTVTGTGSGIGAGKFSIFDVNALATRLTIDTRGNVGLGTTSPASHLDVAGTGAIIVPRDTSAVRPFGVNGMIRYNTDSQKFEVYEGLWQNMITAQASIADNLGDHTATQQILAIPGTAAAPAYTFNGMTNLGMSAVGTAGLGFSTSSLERLRINPNGYIGIGTSSPAAKAHIHGNSATDTLLFVAEQAIISTGATNSTNTLIGSTISGTGTGQVKGLEVNTTTSINVGAPSIIGINVPTVDWSNTAGRTVKGVTATTTVDRSAASVVGGEFKAETAGPNAGTMGSSVAVDASTTVATGDTVSSAYGLKSAVLQNGGTNTYGYGLYISDVQATNQFGVYQLGANDFNYFAGKSGIGTSAPLAELDVTGTGAIVVPRDTSAVRPLGVNGMIRYNTDSQKFEVYEGLWQNMLTPQASGADNLGNHTATQAIVAVTGTAATPSYTFAGENNRGMYAAGTGGVAFATSSQERMRISEDGNVGIGTTSPNFELHVVGQSYITGSLTTGGNVFANELQGSNGTAANPSLTFIFDTDTGLFGNGSDLLGFATAGAERMRISAAGNVGIGTTSPLSHLDVAGTGAIVVPRDTSAVRPFGVNGMIRYNTTLQKFEVYEGLWQNMLTAGDGGPDNLGNHTAIQAILATPGTAASPAYSFAGQTNLGMSAVGTASLAFSTSSAERMRISPLGFVGIGTTSPAGILDVRGGTAISGNGTHVNIGAQNGATNGAGGNIVLMTGIGTGVATGGDLVINLGATSPGFAPGELMINGGDNTRTFGENATAWLSQIVNPSGATVGIFTGLDSSVAFMGGTNSPSIQVHGLKGRGQNNATVTGGKFVGVLGEAMNSNAGTGNVARGVEGLVTSLVGNIVHAQGGYFSVDLSGGTATNSYGVQVGIIEGTNKWSVYVSDPNAPSYFASKTGIGAITPSAELEVAGTGAIIVPRNTSAVRPFGQNGMIRYNTTSQKFEVYQGLWQDMISAGGGADNLGNHTATQAIQAISGTAATPSYTFAGENNRGMYALGTGGIAFGTGSLERIRINANGYVGIGTSNPAGPLDVNGGTAPGADNATDIKIWAQNGGYLGGDSNGGSIHMIPGSQNNTGVPGQVKIQAGIGASTASNYAGLLATTNYAPNFAATVDVSAASFKGFYQGLAASPAGTVRGVASYGNSEWTQLIGSAVGIDAATDTTAGGTINNAYAGRFAVNRTSGTVTNGYGVLIGAINSTNKWSVYSSDPTAQSYFAGNIGVGSITPAAELDVAGTGAIIVPRNTSAVRPFGVNGMIRYNTDSQKFEVYEGTWQNMISAGGGGAGDNLGDHSATQAIVATTGTAATPSYTFAGENNRGMYAAGTGAVAFSAGSLERMRIDSTGNIGIGTSAPAAPLDLLQTSTATSGFSNMTQGTLNITNSSLSSQTANAAQFTTIVNHTAANNGVLAALNPRIYTLNTSSTTNISHMIGVDTVAQNNRPNTVSHLIGERVTVYSNGTGNVFNMSGVDSSAMVNSSTTTSAYGGRFSSGVAAIGTVNNAYGLFTNITKASGTIGTGYGIYVGKIEATNRFGVYQGEADSPNYFGSNIGIGSTSPVSHLDVTGTGAIIVPRNTSAVRPFGVNGMIRYNTDSQKFEVYQGLWQDMISAGGGAGDNLGDHTATTAILAVTGTAATPSYSFSGETDTGLWNAGPNTIAASTGGTERLRIDAFGNVGIGTTNPDTLLTISRNTVLPTPNANTNVHIVGADQSSNSWTMDSFGDAFYNSPFFAMRKASGTAASPTAVDSTDILGDWQTWGHDGTTYQVAGEMGFTAAENWTPSTLGTRFGISVRRIGSTAYGPSFYVGGQGAGVGVQTPLAEFDVTGTGAIIVPRSTTALRPFGINGMIRYNTNSRKFEVYEGLWQNMITPQASGADNLGNHTATQAILAMPGTAVAPSYTFAGATNVGMSIAGTGSLAFSTASTERMRFTSDGLMGIGTTVPERPFHLWVNKMHQSEPAFLMEQESSADWNDIQFDLKNYSGVYAYGGSFRGVSVRGTKDSPLPVTSGTELVKLEGVGQYNSTPGGTFGGGSVRVMSEQAWGTGSATGISLSTSTSGTFQSVERMRVSNSGRVAIGHSTWDPVTAGALLDLKGTGVNFSSLLVPRDIAANRPTAGVNGMIRYNTTSQKFEVYEGLWQNMLSGGAGDNLGNHTATQAIVAVTGTAAAPGYTFAGQNNRGLYALGTGGIAFSTGSLERIQIDAAGKMGFNTAPDSAVPFHFKANVADDVLIIQNTNNAGADSIQFRREDNAQTGAIGYGNSGSVFPSLLFMTSSNADIVFDTNLSSREVLRMKVNGQIGINSPSPVAGAVLDVNGTGNNFSSVLVPRDSTAARPTAGLNGMIRYNTTSMKFEVYEGLWQNMITPQASGADDLGNHTATQAIYAVPGTGSSPGYAFNGTTNRGMWAVGTGALGFSTASAERLRIETNGNVGIGTNNPGGALEVVNNLGAGAGEHTLLLIGEAGQATGNAHGLKLGYFVDASSNLAGYIRSRNSSPLIFGTQGVPQAITLTNTGNVGIGTSAPLSQLDVAGTGAIVVPRNTSAVRPFGINGMIRYNTDLQKFEVYQGLWQNMISAAAGDNLGDHTATTTLLPVSGTQAAPGISYSGDTDTGISHPANDQIAISTSGTAVLHVNSSGQVGIGKGYATPSDVNTDFGVRGGPGGQGVSMSLSAASDSQLPVLSLSRARGSFSGTLNAVTSGSTLGGVYFNGHDGTVASQTSVRLRAVASETWGASARGSYFSIATAANGADTNIYERFRVHHNGNIGINVQGPAVALDVSNGLATSTFRAATDTLLTSTATTVATLKGVSLNDMVNGFGAQLDFAIEDNAVVQNTAGRIGVRRRGADNTSEMFLSTRNAGADVEAITIAPTGLVGIGTTTPAAQLDIAGTGAILVPRNTSAVRPFGLNGMIRYNTTSQKFEVYQGLWQNMLSSGAGSSQWTTNGSDIYYSAGNVAIGTTVPTAKFHVTGNAGASYDTLIGFSTNQDVYLRAGEAAGKIVIGDQNTGTVEMTGPGNKIISGNVGIGTSTPGGKLTVGNSFTLSAASPILRTNAGSLGGSASNELSLASFGYGAANEAQLGVRALRTSAGGDWTTTSIGLGMDVDNSVRAGANIWLHANGNFGIGVSNPGAKLAVSGSSTQYWVAPDTAATGEVLAGNWLQSYNGNTVVLGNASGTVGNGFQTVYYDGAAWKSGIELLNSSGAGNLSLMKGGGNVGIGTTTPQGRLEINAGTDYNALTLGYNVADGVNNGALITGKRKTQSSTPYTVMGTWDDGTDRSVYIGGGSWSKPDATWIGFYTASNYTETSNAGTERMRITPLGRVGIGSTSPSELLDVGGNVRAVSFISTSDQRLKTDIRPLENSSEKLSRINGVQYNWLANGQADMGVIAQDVEKVFPELVVTNNETGYKAVKYQGLIAPLIESNKELYGMCKASEEQLARLTKRVEELTAENAELKKRLDDQQRQIQSILQKLDK